MAWVNSKCKKGDSVTLCIPLCICRLMLAWISSEISTKLLGMPTHLDQSSLTTAALSHTDWSLLLSTPNRHSASLSPTNFSEFLCPTLTLTFSYPLPVTSKIAGSGLCLVSDHLHSVTTLHAVILLMGCTSIHQLVWSVHMRTSLFGLR